MKITLIQESALHSIILPEKKSGQFFIKHTNVKGENEILLSITPENDCWIVKCGAKSSFEIGGENIKEYAVTGADDSITVFVDRNRERDLLLFEDDSAEKQVFHKYVLRSGVTIGSAQSCDVCLCSALISAHAAELKYVGESLKYIETSKSALTFINGVRTTEKILVPGDLIYIKGFSIIIGKNILAFNRAGDVKIASDGLVPYIYPEKDTTGIIRYFDENRQDKLFTISPRFSSEIVPLDIAVEEPPVNGSNAMQRPAIFQLGPSFTMGTGSAVTAAFTLLNGAAEGRDLTSMMPSLVMAISMMMSAMVWPVLAKCYETVYNKKLDRDTKTMYIHYLEEIRKQIADEMEKQKLVLMEHFPTLKELEEHTEKRTVRLWERTRQHSDYLQVCLGLGNVKPVGEIKFSKPKLEIRQEVLRSEMEKLRKEPRLLTETPVVLSLTENRIVGIAGKPEHSAKLLQSIVMQLTGLHSYMDVKLVLIFNQEDYERWGYMRWLPHTWNSLHNVRYIATNSDELKVISAALEKTLNGETNADGEVIYTNENYIVICTSYSLYEKSSLITHIIESDNRNFSVLLAFDKVNKLPKECDIVITAGERTALRSVHSEGVRTILPLDSEAVNFRKNAVSLANITINSVDSKYKLPSMLTFLDMMDVKYIEELNCQQRWQENNPVFSLAAPIGVDTRGDLFTLDLHQKVHGPHGLIAGTTGSGKSEFIMTYILSLAVNYSPRDISFLLIDYKGGGMAVAFKNLPHTAGIITNLDGAAVNRSLISIESELRRRQQIFLEAGEKYSTTINDIYTYQGLCREDSSLEPLQHLFIISDEFAELKKQQPEFMDKLISAARIGRSLGVHLILATQKPSGVVNDQIWSNSRFRVCLKVQDREDSTEVIRCPDAAAITQTGRFYLQVGYNEIFELGQSAWCGADYHPGGTVDTSGDEISVVDNTGRVIDRASTRTARQSMQEEKQKPEKQINLITKYISDIAASEKLHSRPLWLEPIPENIYIDAVAEKYGYKYDSKCFRAVMGEYDIPEQQRQELFSVSVEDGNILLFGSDGSGKTSFLTTYIYEHLSHRSAAESVFCILDFSAETLKAFESYNAVCSVITISQKEKLENMFNYLVKELATRREKLSEYGGGFAEYRLRNGDMPAITVVLSNYGAFKETYDEYEPTVEMLSRDGQKLGIFFIITALSPVFLKYKLTQSFKQKITMHLEDGAYNSVVGTTDKIPSAYRGRGLAMIEKDLVSEFQTAFVCEDDVFAFIRSQAEVINSRFKEQAFKIKTLPAVYTPELAQQYYTPDKPNLMPFALETKFAEPVYLDVSARIIPIIYYSTISPSVIQAFTEFASRRWKLYVIDPKKQLQSTDDFTSLSGAYAYNALYELHSEMLKRHKQAKKAAQGGEEIPHFERILCIINGFSAFEDLIKKQAEENAAEGVNIQEEVTRRVGDLHLVINGSPYDIGLTFVIIDKASSLYHCSGREWFTERLKLNSFVWIGANLASESTFRHSRVSDSKIDFGDDLGYSVVKGSCEMIKLLNCTED